MSAVTAWLRKPIRFSDPVYLGWMIIVVYAAFFAGSATLRKWPVDAAGHPIPVDYLSFWTAGRFALGGHAVSAYDGVAQKAIETGVVGHDFPGYFTWFYPPTFFFATTPFALLPYIPSLLAWVAAGFALYLTGVRLIVPRRGAVALAAAAPVVLCSATLGQNGFLTAALIGGALALIDRRPLTAGVLIACLTYKPQFGLLIPLALVSGHYWRVFLSASAAAVCLVALSVAAFGADAWAGFFSAIGVAYQNTLVDAALSVAKLQSIYGLVLVLGGGTSFAWLAQLLIAVPVAAFVAWLWRSPASIDLKAAALASGAVLVTPYVLIYDLAVLVVPLAFLARSGLSKWEATAAAVGGLLFLSGPVAGVLLGLASSLIVAGIVLGRILAAIRQEGGWAQIEVEPSVIGAARATSSTTTA